MATKKTAKNDDVKDKGDDLIASPALPITVYPPEDSGIRTYTSSTTPPDVRDASPVATASTVPDTNEAEDSTTSKTRTSSRRSKPSSK